MKQNVSDSITPSKKSPPNKTNTYTLVPRGVGERNQITIRILRLSICRRLVVGRGSLCDWGGLLGCRGGSRRGLDDLLCVQRADLQLGLVLLQNALVVVLPELLRGILSGDSLENYSHVNFEVSATFQPWFYDVLFFPPILHILVSTCDTPRWALR